MSLARRVGVALAIAGAGLALAASAPRAYSPGYTYRLTIDSRIVDPDGKATSFIVMSGRAMVTENRGRLDIDTASMERGAMVQQGYVLYDPTSMLFVSPKDKRILKVALDDLEKGTLSLAANVPGMRMRISDVTVSFEELGRGEPMLGMATTKYRLTQDYELAVEGPVSRNSTEHVVQDLWVANEKKGLVNPFMRLGDAHAGVDSAFAELLRKTAEAQRAMGRGIVLKSVTSATSMLSRNEVTRSASTMQITELQAGEIDDALLVAPADFEVTDVAAQMRAITARLEQAKAAQAAESAKADRAPTSNSAPTSNAAPKQAAKQKPKQGATDGAGQAKQGMVDILHGMGRRP